MATSPSAVVRERISIGKGAVTRGARELFGLSTLAPSPDPALSDLVVAAHEPAWAERLLADPATRSALVELFHDPQNREVRWVLVRPDVVRAQRRWIDPDAAAPTIGASIAALAKLAEAIERQGPPTMLVPASALEASVRRSPTLAAFAIVGGIFVFLLLPLACVAGAAMMATGR